MILLTGGTGLLGSHIAFELANSGKKIRALKREGSSIKVTENIFRFYSDDAEKLLAQIEWVNGDLLDVASLENALQDVTHVFHAAAIVSFHPEDKNDMLKINIDGTANLMNAALEKAVKKFVHISSVAALGRTTDGSEIDENCWWKTSPENSWYAISKYGAEREVWRAIEEGLNAVILNPSFILGAGDASRSSGEIFGTLKKGLRWYTNGITGYVDARDVAKAAVLLGEREISGERFILSAANLTFREFFDRSLEVFGKKKTGLHATKFLAALGWRGERMWSKISGKKPRLTKETAQSAHAVNMFSGKKISDVTGFSYRDINATIRETCAFYLGR